MTTNASPVDSSQIGEIMIQGLEEIIGRPGLYAILSLGEVAQVRWSIQSGDALGRMPYSDISAIHEGLEKMYGPRGGRGIVLRAGRAAFKYLLRQFGGSMAITDLNFRLLPVPMRLKSGLDALAALMMKIGDEQVTVIETPDVWQWRSLGCPLCAQRRAVEPICQFTAGLLQEFFSWGSGGRVYRVSELECQAKGAPACLFQIDKKVLD